jgi:hypothetical protein
MKIYTANSTMGTVLQKLIDSAEGSKMPEAMVIAPDPIHRTYNIYTMNEWKEKQKDDEALEQIRRVIRLRGLSPKVTNGTYKELEEILN